MEIKTTTCMECGRSIRYTTKKPKKCTSCRSKAKKKGYRKKPDTKHTQGEVLLFRALDLLLPQYEYINHGFYSFLQSPKGYPMQLDRYYPTLKLAWEFDGRQHEEYSKYLHGSKEEYLYYRECDRLKEKQCRDRGITLIRVAWNHKITPEALKRDIQKANRKLYQQLFGEE